MLCSVSKFAAVILVIAVIAMPAIACMAADRQMTAEEMSCCQKMAHSCESAAMPNSHSCCHHPVSRQVVTASQVQRTDFAISPAMLVETPLAAQLPSMRGVDYVFASPPESPPATVAVLRI